MKWTLNINQQQAVALGIKNATEAIIFGMICDCASWAEPVIIENEVFYWAARSKFVEDLPLLDLKNDTVYRYFKSLEKLGLIFYEKSGSKDCVKLTNLGKNYYVGKKSELPDNSEKNPSEIGKKSEKTSEKNPTYTSTIPHPSSNHSSSSLPPPPIEEEEGVISAELVPPDPYFEIPEEGIDGLSRHAIIAGVERIVAENAGDNGPYRAKLVLEILSGGGRTLGNIRRPRAPRPGRRIGSNRGETMLPPEVNIFDIIESYYQEGVQNG